MILDYVIDDRTDLFDTAFHHIPGLEKNRGIPEYTYARGCPGGNDVSGQEGDVLGDKLDDVWDWKDHVFGILNALIKAA